MASTPAPSSGPGTVPVSWDSEETLHRKLLGWQVTHASALSELKIYLCCLGKDRELAKVPKIAVAQCSDRQVPL